MEQNQKPSWLGAHARPLCCGCVPLRLGVFVIASISLLTSIVMVFAKSLGVDTSVFFGGYVLESKVCISILEISGAIWGFIGITGAWHCHSNSVSVFFYFQVARLVVWVGVFCFDLPALMVCEQWITDMASQPEWNPRMYQVAMEGKCFEKRMFFYAANVPLFMIFAYFTWVTYEFIEILNTGLPYSFTEKRSHRAFVAQSLAERMPLNLGEWDRREPFPVARPDLNAAQPPMPVAPVAMPPPVARPPPPVALPPAPMAAVPLPPAPAGLGVNPFATTGPTSAGPAPFSLWSTQPASGGAAMPAGPSLWTTEPAGSGSANPFSVRG